ncbi:hypothetical protein EKK58_05590 [Candidatus Dependentiae bacterium]|nr:MAG: hypothetical protein EKK58_05590 [Candidatus Dependentiae bacterium]
MTISIGNLVAMPNQQIFADATGNMLAIAEPGSGATTALLMAACRHVEASDWSAVVFAPSTPDLRAGLRVSAAKLLSGMGAKYLEHHRTYVFKSGATLKLAAQDSMDARDIQGMCFSFVGFNHIERFDPKFVMTAATRARETVAYRQAPIGMLRILHALRIMPGPMVTVRPRACAVVSSNVNVSTIEWAESAFQNRIRMRTEENTHLAPEVVQFLRNASMEHYAE